MASQEVDEFVQARVLPKFWPVVARVRELMRETAPEAAEVIAYGIPMWRARRIFAFLSPTKTDITFGFSRGVRFEDRYGLLRGAGKASKHVKLRRAEDIDADVLRYYIKQAVDLDAK